MESLYYLHRLNRNTLIPQSDFICLMLQRSSLHYVRITVTQISKWMHFCFQDRRCINTRLAERRSCSRSGFQDEVQEVFHSDAGGRGHRTPQQARVPSASSKTVEVSWVSGLCVRACLAGRRARRVAPPRFADAVVFALHLYHCFFMIMNSNRSPWRRWQMLRRESMHIVCLLPDWILNPDGVPYFNETLGEYYTPRAHTWVHIHWIFGQFRGEKYFVLHKCNLKKKDLLTY